MKKLIFALFTVFLLASFTGSKDTSKTLDKIERDLFPSYSFIEGNNHDFLNALSGDLREINKSKDLKKPRTIL